MKVMDLFCGTVDSQRLREHWAVRGGVRNRYLACVCRHFRLNHPAAVALVDDIGSVRLQQVAELTGLGRGEVDVIVGGPPCQGFSSIRPFRSADEDDPRNSLFEEFAAHINYFRPPVFVFENVVGLASYKNGQTIEIIQECFNDLGYETDWRVLNAAHYGVPQKRERLILLGAERGMDLQFPAPTHSGEWRTIGVRDPDRRLLPETATLFSPEPPSLPPALTVMDAIGDLPPVAAGESATEYGSSPQNDYQAARRAHSTTLEWHIATAHTEEDA